MEIIQLLGKSILSEEIKDFSKRNRMRSKPSLQLDIDKNAYDSSLDNASGSVSLSFHGYIRYQREFGEPFRRMSKQKNELFLKSIEVGTNLQKTKDVLIPFDLRTGDDQKMLLQKIKTKPKEKSKMFGKDIWRFSFSDFELMIWFDKVGKLRRFKLTQPDLRERKKYELIQLLKKQTSNINWANAEKVLVFEKKLPTLTWKRRNDARRHRIAADKISLVESVLTDFLTRLSNHTKGNKITAIYNSVRKVVLDLNKINSKNDSFIETLEREEICEFINNAVRLTGLDIHKSVDLTEEWRRW